jgi:hypothetical protein
VEYIRIKQITEPDFDSIVEAAGGSRLSAMPRICALCRTNSDLQNSHIVPEFFYRLIYDTKPRRLHIVSAKPAAGSGRRKRVLPLDEEAA